MWLLRNDIAARIERARVERVFSADELRTFEASREAVGGALPRIAKTAGGVMEINVEGILTKRPDFFAWLVHGANTAYTDIIAALGAASADPNIRSVVLNIDSPGGHVNGLFETLDALQAFSKDMEKRASFAASAAYAIAAAAPGKLIATTRAAEFGSIGVVQRFSLDSESVEITSTNAPRKRPDVSTKEGQDAVREELDALEDLFVDAVAVGRDVSKEHVIAEFGQGGMLIAAEAKRRGMIDSIAKAAGPARNKPAKAGATGKIRMDEKELQAQHPELYAAVFAKGKEAGVEEGKEAGKASEQKRVLAHLKMGKTVGAEEFALQSIAEGKAYLDDDVQAEYQSAGFRRAESLARGEETDEAAAAVAAAKAKESGKGAETEGGTEGEKDLQDEALAVLEGQKGSVR